MAGTESFPALPAAALNLAVVPGCVRTNQLMPDSQAVGSCFKESGKIPLAVGKTVGEFKAVVPDLCDTAAGNRLHIHLDSLAWMGHLFILAGNIPSFCMTRNRPSPPVAATPLQPMPQLCHAGLWISAAHIPDQLPFRLCGLVWMAVGPSGLADPGLHTSVPARLSEVDVRPAFVILSACPADAVFLCVLYERFDPLYLVRYWLCRIGPPFGQVVW